MSVLVVGASGILAPAALTLAAAGEDVVALARESPRLLRLVERGGGRIRGLAVDLHDEVALAGALQGRRFASALLYCPFAPQAAQVLAAGVVGRVVVLATSAAAAPGAPGAGLGGTGPHPGEVQLLLGWHADDDQPRRTRWHTPEEVSAAALTTLTTGADAVLGVVRPWSDRPS